MMDEETLEEINDLKYQRDNWVKLADLLNKRRQNCEPVLLPINDYDYMFWPEDLMPRVLTDIGEIDNQLISLGFQPSPLDLKEGEKK